MNRFDLAVIGSGSGNTIIGKEWEGRRVVLFDDAERFGGTCLNRGCIPTKMLVHVADVVRDATTAARLGVTFEPPRVDWPAIRDRVFGRIDEISDSGLAFRDVRQDHVTLVRESVGFQDAHTLVTASGEAFEAEQIVIATGSRPRVPDAVFDPRDLDTSDTIMRIDALPASMLVLGGGAIAAEFAHVFDALGVDVTVAIRGERMLRSHDDLIAERYTALAAARWKVRTNATVTDIERTADGLVTRFADGSEVVTERVLAALGRIPNADVLGAAALFDVDDAGRIETDDELRVLANGTPVKGIFALGDVTSPHELKHVANHQARLVRANLAGAHERDDLAPVPHAIFAGPEVASFGVRSDDAPRDAVVVTREFGSTAYGWALEDDSSFARLVVARDGALLGAHILGPHASILIQPLVQAAAAGRSVVGLARSQYWPHPALSEVVENALLDAEKELR